MEGTRIGSKHCGIVTFGGGVLYVSYGTIVGIRNGLGTPGLFTGRSYSSTTDGHIGLFTQGGDVRNERAFRKAVLVAGFNPSLNAAPVSF
jgi:hypothetical protein